MVTIKKIEITGFFGKGNFVWELNSVVNILGGRNGSGKSTIFRFCYAVLSGERFYETEDEFYSAIFENVVITFSNEWTMRWSRKDNNSDYTLMMLKKGPQAFRNNAIQVFDNTGKQQSYGDFIGQLQVCLINSFEQHSSKASQYENQPKSQPLDDPTMLDLMIKDQIDLRNKDFSKMMEDFVDAPDENENKRSEYVAAYKKIYSSLGFFLDGYDEPFKSSFEFTKNGHRIRFEKLSMGEKQILLLLLMVSNTNQKPCIFFIDEPDLSMHIDWKEELVTRLHELNPNMQIILSTHSPSVITGWHDKVKEVDQLIKR